MRYRIKGQKSAVELESTLELEQRSNGEVVLLCSDNHWVILRLCRDGTFRRTGCLPDDIGLQTDSEGRIRESD